WPAWGEKILRDLTGFWALVIYDKRAQKVVLVRDQFGVKPLYYWHTPGLFCASSLVRTLLEVVPQSADLDLSALSEYVRYQMTFGDKTFLRQIRKVLPGQV